MESAGTRYRKLTIARDLLGKFQGRFCWLVGSTDLNPVPEHVPGPWSCLCAKQRAGGKFAEFLIVFSKLNSSKEEPMVT